MQSINEKNEGLKNSLTESVRILQNNGERILYSEQTACISIARVRDGWYVMRPH